MTYKVLSTISNEFNCHEPLQKESFDYIILNINELITKTNYIATYISGHEGTWEEDYADIYNQGDVLSLRNAIFQSPISLINNMNSIPSKNNAILYYDENNNWEYRYLSDSLSKLLNTSGAPNENQTLKWDGLKWIYSDFISSSSDQQNILLNSDLLKYLNNSLHGGMYNQNPTLSEHVEYVLVYSDGDWSFLQYNPGSSSNPQSLSGYTWWGRSISGTEVKGNLEGNILYIKFGSGTNSLYLGIDSNGNLRLSKNSDGSGSANFYATGGVSALGTGSSGGGSSEQGVTPDLNPILEYINDNDINQSSFEFSNSPELLLFKYTQISGTDKILLVPLSSLTQNLQGTYLKRDTSGNYSWSTPEGTIPTPTSSLVGYYLKAINSGGTITPVWSSDSPDSLGTSVASLSDLNDTFISTSENEENGNANNGDLLLYSTYNFDNQWKNVSVKSVIESILGTADNNSLLKLTFDNNNKLYTEARIASDSYLGLIKTNYTSQNDKYYAIKTDANGNAYVNVPWTNINNDYILKESGVSFIKSSSADNHINARFIDRDGFYDYGEDAISTPGYQKDNLEKNRAAASSYIEWYSGDHNNGYMNHAMGHIILGSPDYDSNLNEYVGLIWKKLNDNTIYKYKLPNLSNNGDIATLTVSTDSGGNQTIWGHNYIINGKFQNVSGTISDVNTIELTLSSNDGGNIFFHHPSRDGNYASSYIKESNVGVITIANERTVAGLLVGKANTLFEDYIQIGNIKLVCEKGTHTLRVIGSGNEVANFYATGGVSALGMSSGTNSIDAMTFGEINVKDINISNEYATYNISLDDHESLTIEGTTDGQNPVNIDFKVPIYSDLAIYASGTNGIYIGNKWRFVISGDNCVLQHNDSNSSTPNWQSKGTWSASLI